MSRADSPTVVDREWRFKPERTYRIPATWADNGRREVPNDGEERYYAVQIKLGVSLHYGVDAAGEIVDGPHRDKPTVRACYVARDGYRAYVRDWDTVLTEDGRVTPERDFASVLAVDLDDADPVEDADNRVWYREVLRERYDVTPIVADGGQSTGRIGQNSQDSTIITNKQKHSAPIVEAAVSQGGLDVTSFLEGESGQTLQKRRRSIDTGADQGGDSV